MIYATALIIAFLQVGVGDGSRAGRRGNDLYEKDELPRAAAAYREGLTAQKPGQPTTTNSGLWNNLGATLFRLGQLDEAVQAFDQSIALSPSQQSVSRAAYNAGNTVFTAANSAEQTAQPPAAAGAKEGGPSLEGALQYYRQALLADPDNEDAKFNYEFVKRRLQEQQEQQKDQEQEQQSNDQNQQPNEDQQDQDQNKEGEQQNKGQQDQNQEQRGDQQNQGEEEQQQQEQPAPSPDPNKMSREDAERILQALQNEEEDLLRQVLKPQTRPRAVEKDW